MPSYYEGMPLALIEAMLSGRTAIVSDVGGASELIENGEQGFIAEENTLYSFNNVFDIAWNKQEYWNEMGNKAFTRTNDYFRLYAMDKVMPEILSK